MSDPQTFSIAEMIFHHTGDAHELELPFGTVIHLPRFDPIHLGPLTVDLSVTKYFVFMVLAAVIVITALGLAARGVRRAQQEGRPPRGFAAAMEGLVLYVRNDIAIANIGHEMGPRYAPLIMALFFFILVCNLLGLVPFGASPTGNLAVTGALALIVLLVIEIGGMLKLGAKGYLRTIFPHVEGLSGAGAAAMSIGMAPIEVLSKIVKPFALMVRLFGNITAGHFVVLALFGIVFMFGHLGAWSYGIAGVTMVMVLGIMMLDLVVAVLQAYVFALLSAVFIGLMQHEH